MAGPGTATDSSARVDAALDRARFARGRTVEPAPFRGARRTLAVGDPQASARNFFAVLDENGTLSEEGWLDPGVRLISIGDHFDYGPFATRREAGVEGILILNWLSAHAPEQVTLIAGNHDLARVAELWSLDDAAFQEAAEQAHAIYSSKPLDVIEQRRLLERFPMFAGAEVIARDLCTFSVEQRELVMRLLLERRFRLAASEFDTLFVHAGATGDDLARAGLAGEQQRDPDAAAAALNARFEDAISGWRGDRPFSIPGFFAAGSARHGEPGGFLFQRPVAPDRPTPKKDEKRRFDPRSLPQGLAQAVGHIRDPKCRELLGDWVCDEPGAEGALRHLSSSPTHVRYARGLPPHDALARGDAVMIFIDGGMHHVPAERYQLLELPWRT